MKRGYVILATTARGERAARDRIAMQRAVGLDARWVDVDEIRRLIPAMAADGYRGGSYVATDGWVDPPRNVRAYSLAIQRTAVSLREGVGFVAIRTRAGPRGRREVTAVETTAGTIATPRVLLTGGPALQAVAAAAGGRAWVGYVRHQVAVTERADALHADTTAMAFDLDAGLYWRPEEGGLLFGSFDVASAGSVIRRVDIASGVVTHWAGGGNAEDDGIPATLLRNSGTNDPSMHCATIVTTMPVRYSASRRTTVWRANDWPYLRAMERRLHRFVPATRGLGLKKVWAATIEYTPDHLPIVGPLVLGDGTEVDGASIASACGHGMMWGPAVSRIAIDLALGGATEVVERSSDLRMDRFDADGRSPLVDPIALPFPVTLSQD